ncbi:MAG: hydrogenase 4 subunit B [Chloroflexi bacterium]|nr:hydrogenase 4 subunit B [Chloroflexota bacterium]
MPLSVADLLFDAGWAYVALAAIVALGGGRARLARAVGYGGCALIGGAIAGGSTWVLLGDLTLQTVRRGPVDLLPIHLRIDPLAALFLLLLGAVSTAIAVAALGYARAYDHHGGTRLAALFALFLGALHLAFLAADAFTFLLGWELVAVVGYFLVVHEHEDPAVRRAGFLYLAMAQLGAALLAVALLLPAAWAADLSFSALREAIGHMPLLARDLALIALLGAVLAKAGGAPLHAWLPRAHPVAPAHVSALLSAVMIKLGVYGTIRLAIDIAAAPAWFGWALLVCGVASALLGALQATVDRDLKRVLAYSSIENVGLIFSGVALAIVTWHTTPLLPGLALTAALLHTLNHGLVKALLFMGAGAVDRAVGTRDLNRLGGLARSMPWTAGLFLLGGAAIAALPPLNLFPAEWLLLQALLALGASSGAERVAAWVAIVAIALTGGLALAAMARAFGITFLGLPRERTLASGTEAPAAVRISLLALAGVAVGLGLFPGLGVRIVAPAVEVLGVVPLETPLPYALIVGDTVLDALYGPVAVLSVCMVVWLLFRVMGRVPVRRGPVWVCGFALQSRMQYSGTSAGETARLFFRSILRTRRVAREIWAQAPYFPQRLSTHAETPHPVEATLYAPVVSTVLRAASAARAIQNGNIRVYLLYVFATLVLLLVGTR